MPEPRPVMLTAAKVRAALAGETVELRRKLTQADWCFNGHRWTKERNAYWPHLDWPAAWVDMGPSPAGNPGPYWHVPLVVPPDHLMHGTAHRLYPLLRPGGRLWVREEHLLATRDGHKPFISFLRENPGAPPGYPLPEGFGEWRCEVRPASKMPRWASRLTLVVTGLRLEPGEPRPFVVEARRDG